VVAQCHSEQTPKESCVPNAADAGVLNYNRRMKPGQIHEYHIRKLIKAKR